MQQLQAFCAAELASAVESAAGEAALPELINCVDTAEVASTLKEGAYAASVTAYGGIYGGSGTTHLN